MIMKTINRAAFILAFAGSTLVGCDKELDVNLSNPNGTDPNLAQPGQVITGALDNTAARINTGYPFANQWMGYWSRSGGYSASTELETFQLTNTYAQGLWQGMYKNNYDYNFIISKAGANSFLGAIAAIMKAVNIQMLVDTYGNIPYTQASQPQVTIRPKYDTATSIYRDLIVQLNSAITAMKAATAGAGDNTYDIMFGGDKTKWVKFANTLKLRILLRQVPKGDQSYVQAQIAAISSEGFLGAGEDAQVNPGYKDATGQQSPLWGYFFAPGGAPIENYNYYRANKTMTDLLKSQNDPRIGYFFNPNSSGGYEGNFFGEVTTQRGNAVTSTIGKGLLKSAAQPALVISAFESLFLQAEAAQRGLTSGNAATLYGAAVAESFRYLGVPNATTAAATYISTSNNADVNYGTSTNKLQTILTQKWIAMCGFNGLEAWCLYRRTGIPTRNNPSLNPNIIPSQNRIPKRLLYPQTEYDLNPDNVKLQNQTQSDLFTPIFWGQ